MPVNLRYPLADVLDACRADHARRRRSVFVEYVMLAGVNDRYEQALALARLLSPREAFKVNLIPYNPTDSPFAGSSRDAIAAFRAALESRGVRVTVRLTRGPRHRRGLRPARRGRVSAAFTIEPRGPFSLRAAAEFGFGPTEGRAPPFDGALRLAFALDGGSGHAGVIARRPGDDGAVRCEVHGGCDPAAVCRQVARVLSLDHDGEAFLEVGERDPVIGELQRRHPGRRPVLFHSPYEAAAWAVISARRPSAQAARVREALGRRLGASFELGGRTLVAFPQPQRLLDAEPADGLDGERLERLRGVARAALEGDLDVARLHALGAGAAWEDVQRIRGIGPFYAGLVVVRGGGFADAVLRVAEPRVLAHVARFYGLPAPPSLEEFTALASNWRPYRTWATVLIRLAGEREFGRPGRAGT